VIETHWDGPRRLRIVAPDRIKWQLNLSSTLATRAMNLMGSVMPDALWESPTGLLAMAAVAGVALGAGKLRLAGRVPNGQHFVANPLLTWIVSGASAAIDGRNLGAVAPLPEQPSWATFGYLAPGCSRSVARFSMPSTRIFTPQQRVEPSGSQLIHQQSSLPRNCVDKVEATNRWSTRIQT
jgi:hypothetical protein